jgi:hypothetical protein
MGFLYLTNSRNGFGTRPQMATPLFVAGSLRVGRIPLFLYLVVIFAGLVIAAVLWFFREDPLWSYYQAGIDNREMIMAIG